MGYTDPQTIHNPATGGVAPASWGDIVRDDLQHLADPPRGSISHSTTQNVATGTTWVVLSADTEAVDTDGAHSTVTDNSRVTIQTPGDYLFEVVARFEANATGDRQLEFIKNGTTSIAGIALPAHATRAWQGHLSAHIFDLVVGDYVEARVRQFSGSTLTTQLLRMTWRWVAI